MEKLEKTLTEINKRLVDNSKVLQHLRENLAQLQKVIAFEKAAIVSVISLFDGLLRTPFDGLIVG